MMSQLGNQIQKKTTEAPKIAKKCQFINRNNSTRIDLWKESLCLWTIYTNRNRNKINRTTASSQLVIVDDYFIFLVRARSLPKKKRVFADISKKRHFYRCTYETTTACCVPHESMNMWFCLCRETLKWKLYVLLLKSRVRYLRGQGMCWNVLDQNKWFIKTDSMKVRSIGGGVFLCILKKSMQRTT